MKQELFHIIETSLVKASNSTRTNVKFKCPFCNHSKKKLEIDLDTELWHCWVCNAKGTSIYSLFKKLNSHPTILQNISELSEKKKSIKKIEYDKSKLYLPSEFIPLYIPNNQNHKKYNKALKYLTTRNITEIDIKRHKIGYCEDGKYASRIIFPSYNINNELDYFVGRTYLKSVELKYLTPVISKNTFIPLENQIDFNTDIYIVEGIFDAIALHFNTIPLYGKTIVEKLLLKLIETQPPNIYIILDNDAIKQSIEIIKMLINKSIHSKIYLIELPNNTDPSKVGFKDTFKLINNNKKELTVNKLLKYKLNKVIY